MDMKTGKGKRHQSWYLDNGFLHHMTGERSMFQDLRFKVKAQSIKLMHIWETIFKDINENQSYQSMTRRKEELDPNRDLPTNNWYTHCGSPCDRAAMGGLKNDLVVEYCSCLCEGTAMFKIEFSCLESEGSSRFLEVCRDLVL
ncbi:hypothetical protein CR513_02995, partial [Mucuna pruriens]